LWKTTTGYELRAVGTNPDASEYGGISINKNIILAMVLSGALAGLGGATHTSGIQYQANQLFGFPNFGFDGITVALVAKSNPIGVIFSALLFGALNYSSAGLQVVGIPSQIASLIQGIVILFIAAEYGFKIIGAKISAKRKKEAVVNE
ncbi:MAG TPA: ABC transporter permease, partial [Clostridiaceae bacterium]|nr:ABC transporter permease [Clostridiaceae bacterium]HCL50380.1 ABC transporter permease [Clostridiaceae bacterium]